MPGTNRQGGFSMAEIMVVMLVLGLSLMAGIPAFSRFMQSNNLTSAAEQLGGHFKLARQQAVAEGIPHIVLYNTSSETYVIVQDDNRNNIADDGEPVQGPFELPNHIDLDNGEPGFTGNQVVLDPDGTASETASVVFTNNREQVITLTLLGPTAQVQITRGSGS
jgi:prepilin-type N-terminal cleavage/methylation domain-containing protein